MIGRSLNRCLKIMICVHIYDINHIVKDFIIHFFELFLKNYFRQHKYLIINEFTGWN
jgi:hypothetical protein